MKYKQNKNAQLYFYQFLKLMEAKKLSIVCFFFDTQCLYVTKLNF